VEPNALIPPFARGSTAAAVGELLFERLAKLPDAAAPDDESAYRPLLASSWEWASDSLSLLVRLAAEAKWHDGKPVRAHDVSFTHSLYHDSTLVVARKLRAQLGGIDSVSILDSTTVVFWFGHREPALLHSALHVLLILPAHLLGTTTRTQLAASPLMQNPVGSGRYRFAEWRSGAYIELLADTINRRERAVFDAVRLEFAPGLAAARQRVRSGSADFLPAFAAEISDSVAYHEGVELLTWPGSAIAYIGFNFRERNDGSRAHNLLGSRPMRRALAMAINRAAFAPGPADSSGAVGRGVGSAIAMLSPALPVEPIPFDLGAAGRILDSLGWKSRDSAGVRVKAGRRLELGLLLPSSSFDRMRIALLAADDLRAAGVAVNIEAATVPGFHSRMQAGDFDLYFGEFELADGLLSGRNQPDSGAAPLSGLFSTTVFPNAAFKAAIDSARDRSSSPRRALQVQRAYRITTDEAAAIWMFTPRVLALAGPRIRIPRLSPRGWWANMDEWAVVPRPAAER
jgi:peptide/nickel transport system substrate-binding protein